MGAYIMLVALHGHEVVNVDPEVFQAGNVGWVGGVGVIHPGVQPAQRMGVRFERLKPLKGDDATAERELLADIVSSNHIP